MIVAELIGDYVKAGVDMACFWPMRYPVGWNVRALLDVKSNRAERLLRGDEVVLVEHGTRHKTDRRAAASNKQVYTC